MLSFLVYVGFQFIIFIFINALLLSIGIGIGFLLNWMLPSIDIRIGSLIGVISAGISFYYYLRVASSIKSYLDEVEEENDDNSKVRLIAYPKKYSRDRGSKRKHKK